MGIGFPEPTAVIVADVNVHNYDASIGQKDNAESLAVTLSTDQETILQSIATAVGGGSGGFNAFNTAPLTDGSFGTVVSKAVLLGETMEICGFNVWGDSDAEWSLEKTSGQIGGTRTSPSNLADQVSYEQCISVVGPDTVTIKARHWYVSETVDFYANLLGRIV